jgi:hypothetical protein
VGKGKRSDVYLEVRDLRGDDHDGIITHGRSREFRMHMKNPAQTGSGCIRFNDLNLCMHFY